MSDLNSVVLVGRLTRDADLRYTSAGYPIANFSIAVNRSVKTGEGYESRANFFDIELFGKIAESLNPYLLKGKQITLRSELVQQTWNDNSSGQKRSKVVVKAADVQLLGGSSENAQNHGGARRAAAPSGNSRSAAKAYNEYVPEEDDFPEEIPF